MSQQGLRETMPRLDIDIRRESIRTAAAIGLIEALNADLLRRYPEDGTAQHFTLDADEVAEGRGAFFVIYHQDEPAGCGALRQVAQGTGEIKRMYVQPSMRGHGLGRMLLTALEAEARQLGFERLVLETGPRQPEAVAVYRQAGFTLIGPFGDYAESPLSTFLEKEL